MSETDNRNSRRRVVGVVTSTKMKKTIVVRCDRTVQHPQFKKYLKRSTVYKAHDEKGEAQVGDRVELAETRPLSKTKFFRLLRVVEKSRIPHTTPDVGMGSDAALAATTPADRRRAAGDGKEG